MKHQQTDRIWVNSREHTHKEQKGKKWLVAAQNFIKSHHHHLPCLICPNEISALFQISVAKTSISAEGRKRLICWGYEWALLLTQLLP